MIALARAYAREREMADASLTDPPSSIHANPSWLNLMASPRRNWSVGARMGSAFGDDEAIRTGGAGSPLQSSRRRGFAESRLRIRDEGARQSEARVRRSVFLPSARGRGDSDRA